MIKNYLTKERLYTLIFVLVVLHPFYEMDYLFADTLAIRPTTIINFIVFPLLVLLTFFLFEKNKKKVFTIAAIYGILLLAYFIPHCITGAYLQDHIHLGYTFVFTVKDEIIYILTLLLPLAYIYVFYLTDLSEELLEKISTCMSFVISVPILVSNIFHFGLGTYSKTVSGNIFDWFSMPFNDGNNHPRNYATKFFFEEGNTISIILVMLLPLMYYFFLREKDKRKRVVIGLLIVVDSLAMLIIGTRIASYCAALIPACVIVVYLFVWLIKSENIKKGYIVFCVVLTIINAGIIPYCPAYQNQQYDASDYSTLKLDDSIRQGYRRGIEEGAEGMEPFGPEWIDYYCYMFLQYKFLIGVTPPDYYLYYYDYRVDPKFWVDLIFDYELEERINSRQLETIFYKYKWNYLTPAQKLTGFTYSLFMWGGINIEKDFIQQFYSFGYLGFPLIMGPWIVLFLYIVYKFIRGFNNKKWNYYNIILLMSVALGTVCSLFAGHVFDQLSSNVVIALCCAYLLKNLRSSNEQA